MSKEVVAADWGSKELPLVVKVGEEARLNYRFYQTGPLYFKIRFKNGKLSELIEYPTPRHNCCDVIFAQCECCSEKAKVRVVFF